MNIQLINIRNKKNLRKRLKKITFITLMLIFMSLGVITPINTASSINMKVEWEVFFGGTGEDCAGSVLQTADGGFIIAGWTYSFGAGGVDFWLLKLDATGTMMWNKTYGGASGEMATSLIQTTDKGYTLGGWTYSYGAGESDYWLVKTDANGQAEWNQTFGGPDFDYAHCLIHTTDGGYALVGSSISFGAGESDFWLVKTDANGQAEWNQTFGGPDWDWAHCLIHTADGGYALAGRTSSFGAGENDFWLVKTDANGQHEWNQTFGGTAFDDAKSVIQTVDGGFALAGMTESSGAGNADFWLVKTDANGQHEWNQTFGGRYSEDANAVIQTDEGGFILTGSTLSFGAGWNDFWLVKTDPNGQHEWNQTFGSVVREGFDSSRPMTQTTDGGLILTGWTESYGAGGWDTWVLKLSEAEVSTTSTTTVTTHPSSSTSASEETTTTATPGTAAFPSISLIVLIITGLMIRLKRRKERS